MKKSTLYLLLAFILLFISFIVYKEVTRKVYFDIKYLPSSSNLVVNHSSNSYIDTLVTVGLVELEVDSIETVILDIRPHVRDNILPGHSVDGFVVKNVFGQYEVYINPELSRRKTLDILSHELIHVDQQVSGRLVPLSSEFSVWEGDTLRIADWEYKSRPWEREAYRNQSQLKVKIKNKVYE